MHVSLSTIVYFGMNKKPPRLFFVGTNGLTLYLSDMKPIPIPYCNGVNLTFQLKNIENAYHTRVLLLTYPFYMSLNVDFSAKSVKMKRRKDRMLPEDCR